MSNENYRVMLTTIKAVIVLSLIWYGLELLVYHELREDAVDTIMLFIFIPIIVKAVKNDYKRKEEERWDI